VIDQGEDQTRFSIIAACTGRNPFGAERFDHNLFVAEASGWFGIQRGQGSLGIGAPLPGNRLFSAEEILGHIDSLG
jgi:hypothetical protein